MSILQLPKTIHPDFTSPYKKPVGPVRLNRSNGFAPVAFCWAALEESGNRFQDYVTGVIGEDSSGSSSWVGGTPKYGKMVDKPNDAYIKWDTSLNLDSSFTVTTIVDGPEIQPNSYFLWYGSTTGSFGDYSVYIYRYSGSGNIELGCGTGYGSYAANLPTTGRYILSLLWDNVSNTLSAYVDGVLHSSGTISISTSPSNASTHRVYIGARGESGFQDPQHYTGGLVIHNGVLSEGQIQMLHRDYYKTLFEPAVEARYIIPAVVGGSNPKFNGITSYTSINGVSTFTSINGVTG